MDYYWVSRLEFGIGYLETIQAVRRAAIAEEAEQGTETSRQVETALAAACRILESDARIVCDQSDRGALAVLNEYVSCPLKAKAEHCHSAGLKRSERQGYWLSFAFIRDSLSTILLSMRACGL